MMKSKFAGLLLAAQLLVTATAYAQGGYKVESVALPAGSDVPAALAALLQPQGARVLDSSGATVCEIWLGNSIPLGATPNSSPDVMYGSIGMGTLVGLVHFPAKGADFRGQAIKPGFYTLRYGLTPQDGNHMGVNPTRDFLLMCPVAQDTNLTASLSFQDMVKLSKAASGTNHPGIFTMDAPGSVTAASLAQDDQGHTVLQAPAQGKSAAGATQALNLAIVVVGTAPATE
jgi:hypothetical protein